MKLSTPLPTRLNLPLSAPESRKASTPTVSVAVVVYYCEDSKCRSAPFSSAMQQPWGGRDDRRLVDILDGNRHREHIAVIGSIA